MDELAESDVESSVGSSSLDSGVDMDAGCGAFHFIGVYKGM